MKQKILSIIGLIMLCTISITYSQTIIKGKVVDSKTNQPLEGVSINLSPNNTSTITDARGNFMFKVQQIAGENVAINNIGYAPQNISVAVLQKISTIALTQQQIQLQDVVVGNNNSGNQYRIISKSDIALRGVNNSQEILRIIPGIVIGQHQGGGKAEQIFLRGFDADHGTDFRLDVDGMPINMVSHAHGQGYADSHFIIPETVENVDFKKGPYTASKGDFNTTGFVDFNTKNALVNNVVKVEAGMFNTYRALGMFNLLSNNAKQKQQSWYVASEYSYSDAYFDNPQHFKRFNLFTKYVGKLSAHTSIIASATTFFSKWDASGQIPDRAVKQGIIGFYGAIDPFEGGVTRRTNANVQLVTSLNNGGIIKNQVYYSNSQFDLHTNFTFFLVDSINGDELRQQENRNLMGYNGSYQNTGFAGNLKITTEAGVNVRVDATKNSALSHTMDRFTTLDAVKFGNITQYSISPYISETFSFNNHFSINAGLRFDQFNHIYNNLLASDTTLPGKGIYKANANTISPKLNVYYQVNDGLQFYVSTGKGYHSNDTRAVVVQHGYQILPSVYGSDFGTVWKPSKNLIINAAVWYIYLQQEFVYSGDGGDVSFNGKTARYGFDFSGRYQPIKSLYFDVDVNYAHGRTVEDPKGQNYIPLAPVWTSTGGVTYTNKNGINGSLRYRYTGNRPGNQDYTLTAERYFITDAVINYTKPKYEVGLVINNVLNTKWKETQFATETRLKGEGQSVSEICFTPGTPLAIKAKLAIFF